MSPLQRQRTMAAVPPFIQLDAANDANSENNGNALNDKLNGSGSDVDSVKHITGAGTLVAATVASAASGLSLPRGVEVVVVASPPTSPHRSPVHSPSHAHAHALGQSQVNLGGSHSHNHSHSHGHSHRLPLVETAALPPPPLIRLTHHQADIRRMTDAVRVPPPLSLAQSQKQKTE